jgi:gluconolactonase
VASVGCWPNRQEEHLWTCATPDCTISLPPIPRLPEGPELTTYALGSSNGLTLDRQGRVLAAEHDGRRLTRVADDGTRTVLAERFQGKRLNSPNDIVVKSDGAIYFTDPPYAVQPSTPGMPRPAGWWTATIPGKELPFNGVYRLTPDGTLQLLLDDFALPNGLAFSPDESVLYVDDSAHKHIRAFDVLPDGKLTHSRILVDMASEDPGVPDGLKVDLQGNVFCTGPGGVWGVPPQGRSAGAYSPAGGARELGLGRGWKRALHHRAH